MTSPFPNHLPRETAIATIDVLVADNHELVREGMKFAFQSTEIEVVAEADEHALTVRLALEKSVDVLLLDIGWGDQESSQPCGFQILREIRAAKPDLPILIYSMHNRESYKTRCRELGARGYVVKGVPNQTLVNAIRRAQRGEEKWFICD